jgi:uncharacterized protein DUF4926
MTRPIQLLDVVALTEGIADRNLNRGHVGTVVELLDDGVFEIEFSDNHGRTYATVAVPEKKLMVLYDQPAPVASS